MLSPAEPRVCKHQEIRIDQRVLGVVAQAGKAGVRYPAARFLDDALAGGAVPLRGGPEACVYIGNSFSHQAEFQGTADCYGLDLVTHLPEERLLPLVAVRAAAGDDQGVSPAGLCLDSEARSAVALLVCPSFLTA